MRTESQLSPKQSKPYVSLGHSAVTIINDILNCGNSVQITLVGNRLRITEVRKDNVKYDIRIS